MSRDSSGSSSAGPKRPAPSPAARWPTSVGRWASGQSGSAASLGGPMRVIDLELDLDVFAGPFDLLLTLILREEVDLLEVDLAEVVITYIDHLERRGGPELGAAAEVLGLIAGPLERKTRPMLPGEGQGGSELEPGAG